MRCRATMKNEFRAGNRAQSGKLVVTNSSPAGGNRQGIYFYGRKIPGGYRLHRTSFLFNRPRRVGTTGRRAKRPAPPSLCGYRSRSPGGLLVSFLPPGVFPPLDGLNRQAQRRRACRRVQVQAPLFPGAGSTLSPSPAEMPLDGEPAAGETLADHGLALSGRLECPVKGHVLARPVTGWLGRLGLQTRENGASAGVAGWETRHDQSLSTTIRGSWPSAMIYRSPGAPLFSLLLALLLFAGCAWPGVDTHEKHPVYPTPADAYHPNQP